MFISLTTPIEWEEATYGLIRKTSTQTAASKQMRSFIDTVIHEAIESVSFCCQAVNQEFCRRIYETRLAKEALESTQGTTLERLNNVTKSIGEVRAEIVDKEEFIKRCMNRLTNRAQRPGPELCKDRAQIALCDELKSLQQSIEQLQGSIDAVKGLSFILKFLFALILLFFPIISWRPRNDTFCIQEKCKPTTWPRKSND